MHSSNKDILSGRLPTCSASLEAPYADDFGRRWRVGQKSPSRRRGNPWSEADHNHGSKAGHNHLLLTQVAHVVSHAKG